MCVCGILALAVLAVFGQTARFEFVHFDDNRYVYENTRLASGLSLKGVVWAFTHAECLLYHPLTMISLRLDYQLHGLHAGGYHLTNVLIHTASSILLFLILQRMTGALWRSAFVAAVFAIHPLRAESVAWVTERKDVLAAFFFILTVGAYVRYVRNPKSTARYLLVAVLFVSALLCKPTAVTLPFVLLLLDYWPLQRFGLETPVRTASSSVKAPGYWGIPRRLILEKIPLLALAAGACVVTYLVVQKGVISDAQISMPARLGNVCISYVVYLRQMVWPAGLAAFYPFPEKIAPFWEIALALLLLAVISGAVYAGRRKRPWLLAGWCWYLGMLVPVIGIVGVGEFAHADRNTYLPQIGLYLLLTWAVADWCAGWKHRRLVLGGLMIAAVGSLGYCGRIQTSNWKDSQSLWRSALACTSGNYLAHKSWGDSLEALGKHVEAIAEYRKALDIKPDYADARNDLGISLDKLGKTDEAILQYRQAIVQYQKARQINPAYPMALNNLGVALLGKGEFNEAVTQFRKALEIMPNHAQIRNNLGMALSRMGDAEALNSLGAALFAKGDLEAAIAQYRKAIEIKPDYAEAIHNLGSALATKGDFQAAIAQYRKALEIKPDYAEARNNLGNALFMQRDLEEAIAQYEKASQLSGGANPAILRALAAAYAETGSYGQAADTARRALELAREQKNDALAAALEKEIKLYEANTPARDATR